MHPIAHKIAQFAGQPCLNSKFSIIKQISASLFPDIRRAPFRCSQTAISRRQRARLLYRRWQQVTGQQLIVAAPPTAGNLAAWGRRHAAGAIFLGDRLNGRFCQIASSKACDPLEVHPAAI